MWKILWIFKVGIKISVFYTVWYLLKAILSKKCFHHRAGISEVFWLKKSLHRQMTVYRGLQDTWPALKGHRLANQPLNLRGVCQLPERDPCWITNGWVQWESRHSLWKSGSKLLPMLGQWRHLSVRENTMFEETQLVKWLVKITI